MTSLIVATVVLAGVSALAFQRLARFVITYRLTDRALSISIFGVAVLRIAYTDIVEVRRVGALESLVPSTATRFGNRIFGEILLIRKSRGLIRKIMVTPDEPTAFARGISERAPEARVDVA